MSEFLKLILEIIGASVLLMSFVSLLYAGWRWSRKKYQTNPEVKLNKALGLKDECARHLPRKNQYGVRGDAIIRDLKRQDQYPGIDDKAKGISPWFKVEVKDIYHGGLEVFISPPQKIRRNKTSDEWNFTDGNEMDNDLMVWAVGRIPFSLIERVDWTGDEFYNVPHIYCRFEGLNGQPYTEIPFYHQSERSDYLYQVEGFRPFDKKVNGFHRMFF